MATWKGSKHYYRDLHSEFKKDEAHHFSWEYQTTADVFILKEEVLTVNDAYGCGEIKGRNNETYLGPEDAMAIYRCIRSWILRYQGEKELAKQDALADKENDVDYKYEGYGKE